MFIFKTIFLYLFVLKCVLAAPSTLLPDTVEHIETSTTSITENNELPVTDAITTQEESANGEIEYHGTYIPESPLIDEHEYLIGIQDSSEESEESSEESKELNLYQSSDTLHTRTARGLGLGVGFIGVGGGFGSGFGGGFGGYGYRPYYPRYHGGYGYGYGRPWSHHQHYRYPYIF